MALGAAAAGYRIFNTDKAVGGRKRENKFLSVFNVIQFRAEPCEAGDEVGICQAEEACRVGGGTNIATCASGKTSNRLTSHQT